MKAQLRALARASGLRARVHASRVALLLRLYRRDPVGNAFLRLEAEAVARKVVYHMRQATILGALIEQKEHKERQAKRLADQKEILPVGRKTRVD